MDNKKKIAIIVLVISVVLVFVLTKRSNKDSAEVLDDEVIAEEDLKESAEVKEDEKIKEQENSEEDATNIEIGQKIRDFVVYDRKEKKDVRLKNLQGEEVSIDDYKGKIVFINFWATWCVYCDAEMPDLQRIEDENEDVVVLAVNVLEDKKLVEDYIKDGGYNFEVILDENGTLAEDFYVAGFPSTYFIDPEGIFLGRVPQMITYEQMNEILADIRSN